MSNRMRVVGIVMIVIGLTLLGIFRDSTDTLGGFGPGISLISAGVVVLIFSARRNKPR